jgi:hypothetical protein
VTVKRQRDGFGAYQKEMGCRRAPPQGTDYYNGIYLKKIKL